MEVITLQSPMDSPYVTAPSSPSRVSSNSHPVFFYSVPTSPTSGSTTAPFVWESEAESSKTSAGVASNLDDFKFEISQSFKIPLHQQEQEQKQKQQQEQQHGGDLPTMSFADELFCNGQVLPLKPPPRLQYINNGKCSNRSSTASSPSSPSLVLKRPFLCWSFKNNDFDPFMAALEHVRKEERGRVDIGHSHRRTRSLSPLRITSHWSSSNGTTGVQKQNKEVGPQQPIPHVRSTTNEPTEHKRLASQTNSNRKRPIKPTPTTLPGPTMKPNESSKSVTKSEGTCRKGSKRQKNKEIKDLLFKNASGGRTDLRKFQDLRKLSFKSIHETHYNAKKEVPEELRKKTLIPYRPPGLLVCLGFGPRNLRNMN